MRTFRIDDSFTKNCKDDMAKKAATLYLAEAVGFTYAQATLGLIMEVLVKRTDEED